MLNKSETTYAAASVIREVASERAARDLRVEQCSTQLASGDWVDLVRVDGLAYEAWDVCAVLADIEEGSMTVAEITDALGDADACYSDAPFGAGFDFSI